MISLRASEAIYEALKEVGIDFVTSIPCNWTHVILELLSKDEDIIHVPVTREEEGVGICAGAYLGGRKSAIIMQSSGLGNCINALASLNQTYKIPLLLLISHRGVQKEKIVAQVPMGKALLSLLDSIEIGSFNIDNLDETESAISEAFTTAFVEERPVAVILSPDLLLED